MNDEQWKEVPGYPGHFASTHGRVKGRRGHILKPNRVGHKRHLVAHRLYKDTIGKTLTVHRIILETFVGPCPDGMEGCHNDGDPTNNRLDNLRWDTHASNMADSKKHGTFPTGEKRGCAKLTNEQVIEMRRLANQGVSGWKLAKMFKVAPTTALSAISGKTWSHLPETA